MIRFECDYGEGAHPKVLKKLVETNLEQTPGYSTDEYCDKARELIKKECKRQDIDVHFLFGGTLTNLTVISAALRPHQGVISAETGHINVHESGAIEATGHKVLALPTKDGKITAEQIQNYYDSHFNDATHEHMVQPKLVYITQSTELGTVYTKAELTAISQVCKNNDLYLFIDGARLGYAICSEGSDLDLATITDLCDVYYIGATKIGILFGEAVVIKNEALKADFRYIIKQKGGLSAKGRLFGLQFIALFEDGLYYQMSEHADKMAIKIKKACLDKGYRMLTDSPSNQQFPIIPDAVLEKLSKDFAYSYIQRMDENSSAIRLCTSWATKETDVDRLVEAIKNA